MSKLTQETLLHLTQLSRIECSKEEQEKLLKNLQDILEYITLLEQVDTTNVAPCNHVLENMSNVMREDIVEPSLPRELFLANAPAHVGGMIRVPPVMKQG